MTLFKNVRLIRRGWWGFQLPATFILMIAGIPTLLGAAQSNSTPERPSGSTSHNHTDSKHRVTLDGDARVGKGLFDKHCVTCHGPRGKGDGLEIVGAEVADLTSAATQRKLSMDLLSTIHEGRPGKVMPPWKWRLSEQQTKDVLAYVRTLRK
jgi:mono/diheme cytochrome c family protein